MKIYNMECRIGITTNLEARKAHWEREYVNVQGWRVLGTYDNREDAQAKETEMAKKSGCEASPGGADSDNPNDKWHVYGFNHEGKKLLK